TNMAFVNITRECKGLVEFTVRNYPWQTLASIVHTLATRNKGTLRIFKAYDTGIRTNDNSSNHKLNAAALERLAVRCPQIKSMVLRCRMQESNGSVSEIFFQSSLCFCKKKISILIICTYIRVYIYFTDLFHLVSC